MMKQYNNDSLVYSEGGIDDQVNLLHDSHEWTQSILQSKAKKPNSQGHETIKIQKMPKLTIENNISLAKYIKNDSIVDKQQISMKSFRKLGKEKQKFLTYDQKVQKVALKATSKSQKINQLATLIECQKILHNQNKLKQFGLQLLQIAQDLINQKKSLQRQIQSLIDLNKLMTSKLKDVEKTMQQVKHYSRTCCCQRNFSFSKNKATPINYLDRFQFAKTIISSIQELELKKIQEQQRISTAQMPFVQLLLILKNKAQGSQVQISQGLLDRIACGQTLKQWIKTIDQKLSSSPNISDFAQVIQKRENSFQIMNQFISTLKNNQKNLIKNIKESKDPYSQTIFLRNSAIQTYLQILHANIKTMSKQQAIAYFGTIHRSLTVIQKQLGIQLNNENRIYSLKQINYYMEQLF